MHLQRILTALVALPLLILLIAKGGAFLFSCFIGIVSVIALSEYYRIVFNNTSTKQSNPILLCGYLTAPAIISGAFYGSPAAILTIVAVNLLACGILSLPQLKNDPKVPEIVSKQINGIIYIPLLLANLIVLRGDANGVQWIFMILLLVAAGDTGAFYSGMMLGKNKLCPNVSPKKTIEGFIGGLILTIAIGIAYRHFFLPEIDLVISILMFVVIGLIAPLGDLYESVLKRVGDIKDSGSILPGHGGILDRIDALLFAAPVAGFFKVFLF